MSAYNRKDNDGHKFLIPEELIPEFDELFERYCSAPAFSELRYDLEAEFCNKFQEFMIG